MPILERAVRFRRRDFAVRRARTAFDLARALATTGRHPWARRLAEAARTDYARAAAHAREPAEVHRWLSKRRRR